MDHPAHAVGGSLLSLVFFLGFSLAVFAIARSLSGPTSSSVEASGFLRTFAFAEAPYLLMVLSPLPLIGQIMWPIAIAWSFVIETVAVRQAFGFSTFKAFAINFLATVVIGAGFASLTIWIFYS